MSDRSSSGAVFTFGFADCIYFDLTANRVLPPTRPPRLQPRLPRKFVAVVHALCTPRKAHTFFSSDSKPHTTGKSTTVKHTTTTTKRVTTTKKPTSTHKPATSTKKPSSSTKKPSSSSKTHASTSPAHPTHTHKPVKSASLYAGWMIYGDNVSYSLHSPFVLPSSFFPSSQDSLFYFLK